MKEDGGKEVMSGLAELGFSPHSSSIVKKVVTDCDFEREESGEVCEKEVEVRGMKNGSGLTSLHEGRKCTAAEVELDNGDDGDWKEMGEDLPNGDFEKEGEKEIKIGLEGLSLHEAKKCTETVEIRTEDNGNEKEETEQGQDCNFEKNGGDKREKNCEKKEGKIEMKNSFEISLHETREYAAKSELYAENNGDLKKKREEGPDCTFEKIDGEKRYEICEKEEGEKEIENGKERDCTEPSELNTENWESKEKIGEGPDSNFEKQMGEKDVKNEVERKYDEKVELHIEDKERSKEKVEEGPDCNFEKEGDEKSNEMLKNLMRREFTPKVELNTEENGDVNGKIEQGPDCDFEKSDAELKEEIHDKKKGEGKNDEFEKKEGVKVKYVVSYPQRIGRSDCPHYLKTGICSYGYKCCFNHPPNIADQFSPKSSQDSEETYEQEKTNNEAQLRLKLVKKDEICKKKENCEFEKKEGAKVKYALPYRQRKGRPDCPSYLKTVFCSYGSKCLYNHPNQISDQFSSGSSWDYDDTYETEKINNSTQYVGLPIRPGQIDCPYYMKHGSCKYSTDCRYNHPNHFITKQNPLNYEEYQNNQYIENNDPLNYEEPNHFVTKQNPLHYEEYQNNRHIENNDPLNCEEPNHFVNKQGPLNYEEYQNNGYLENNDPLNYEEPNHFITKQNQHEGYQNNENFEENNNPYIYDDSSLNELDRSNVLLPINIKNMVLPKYEGDLPPNVKAMLLPPQRLHDTKQVPVSNSSYETYEEYFMDSSTSMSKSISSEKSKANLSEKSKPQSSEKSKSNPSEKSKSNSSYQMEVPFEFPERPGQEECAFYMKSGDCKFKSSCKFHHPRDRLSKKDYVGRNSSRNGSNKARLYDAIETRELLMSVHQKGLREHQFPSEAYGQENLQNGKIKQKKREKYPERPGKPLCEYYMKHGDCKFKFTCKFHHPKDPYQQDLAFPTSDSEYRGCSGQHETGWN